MLVDVPTNVDLTLVGTPEKLIGRYAIITFAFTPVRYQVLYSFLRLTNKAE